MSLTSRLTLGAAVVAALLGAAGCNTLFGPPPPPPQAPPPPAPPPPPPPPPPAPPAAVVLFAAGNIADCGSGADEATAALIANESGVVLTLGDNAFPDGTSADYTNCYNPAWGQFKDRTWATMGNHEYHTGSAAAAFDYFGDRAGPRDLGYYSFDVGEWHVVVLNDHIPGQPFTRGSAQDQWLEQDLAANQKRCTLAAWHAGAFLSSNTPGFTVRDRRAIWDRLHEYGVDVVLNAQQHHYERLAPMRPDGTSDPAGIREFNVGTGGESVVLPTVAIHPNSEVRAARFGVLKLTLESNRYHWDFLPISGAPVDSGSASCH